MPYFTRTEQPPQVTRTYRAALYIRLSREDGDKTESDSVTNQRRLLTNFAQSQSDIESFAYYVDDGYSGANFNRPDFLRMMADVYSSKIDCVIVKDSSRFGRNASESGRYIGEVFPKLRVRYIAVNDAIDSGRSQGVAIDFLNNSMRGMINEYYVAANSENICATLNMERRRGDFIGSFAKYGYKKDPADHHKLIIDEEAAEVVRLIYRLFLNGSGIRTIVRYLNDNGIPNPSTYKCRIEPTYRTRSIGNSPLWNDKTVRRTLGDEMYIGNMVQGKFKKVSYKDKAIIAQPKEEWIKVQNTHEAIIEKEDFERAQKMLNSHAKASPKSGEISLFSGLIRCADCGHALIKKTNRNSDKTYVYYRCSTYYKCKGACTAHSIRYEKLYNAVLSSIRMMVDVAVNADEVLSKMKHNKGENRTDILKARIQSQENALKKLTNQMSDLYPDYKNGLLNKEQYMINKTNYEQKIRKIKDSISSLKNSADNTENTSQPNKFIEHFKKYGNIEDLTRPVLLELVDKIIVHENSELDIVFRFNNAFKDTLQMINEKNSQHYRTPA